jgi:hypothetical protein
MRHVDEGTIHALLDRELTAADAEAVRGHLAGCPECNRMLDEARLFQDETDQLLASLEPPAVPAGGGAAGQAAHAGRPGGDLPFIMMPDPDPDAVAPPTLEPVILLPPEPEIPRWEPPRRRRPWLMAASVALLAGGFGYVFALGGGDGERVPSAMPAVARFDAPASAAELGTAVEAARTESTGPTEVASASPPPRPEARPEARTEARAEARAEAPPASRDASSPPAAREPQTKAVEREEQPARQPAQEPARPAEEAPAAQTLAAGGAAGAARDEAEAPSSAEERVRRLEEGRRATQEIAARQATETASRRARLAAQAQAAPAPSAAASEPAPAPAAPAPPPVSAMERRYGITTRLGLDEVRGILGGPMHVILDMRPMVTGMAESGTVSGAARDRAVVRVVYIDPAQRVITLDQQRRPGGRPREPQITSSGERRNAQWVAGDVWLSLSASMPESEFQALVRRVR